MIALPRRPPSADERDDGARAVILDFPSSRERDRRPPKHGGDEPPRLAVY